MGKKAPNCKYCNRYHSSPLLRRVCFERYEKRGKIKNNIDEQNEKIFIKNNQYCKEYILSQEKEQTLINQYGKCIYDGVIYNKNREHIFICKDKDKDIEIDYIKLYLSCKECGFTYPLRVDYKINHPAFLTILIYGVYEFGKNDMLYSSLTGSINGSLYQKCKNICKKNNIKRENDNT